MQIEAGKFYRTRDGRRVGPAKYSSENFYEVRGYPWALNTLFMYRPNGVAGDGDHEEYDLVSEWGDTPASPVRIVTRKEIVGGVYGAIQITAVYDDGVNICANPGKWSSDDLRAAAATLIELADALPLNAEGGDK